MPESAFGVEHGEIAKFANDKRPFAGGVWGPNATPDEKSKYKRNANTAGAVAVGGALGPAFSSSLKSKPSKIGMGISAAGIGAFGANAVRGKKKGVVTPNRDLR